MQTLKYKFVYWLSVAILGMSVFLIGQISVILYYPFKTIDVKQPMKVISNLVIRGEWITYVCEYKKYIDKDAELLIQLYSVDLGHYVSLPNEFSNILCGEGIAIKSVRIPRTVVVGNYKLLITVKYKLNSLRTIVQTFETEKFQILDK